MFVRKEKEKPVKNDVKILGVVVTGTAENLKILKEQNYIKSATLGVVANKY
ncbi:anti sigma factor C-terminal domain-containing protein [Peribacillus loiseleuriae]|uniref:anti sigma factor C-terminal domain-containing protein n=1 Tax=Peribacillus loiseleuriae TaxID=1679170 RepID=UPI0009E3707E